MTKKMFYAMLAMAIFAVSCGGSDDNTPDPGNPDPGNPDPTTSTLTLEVADLEDLGDDFVYEGWIIVDGNAKSTGILASTDASQTFEVNKGDLEKATKFVLTIEPKNDDDPAPSATKILAGDFSGNTAAINSDAAIVAEGSSITSLNDAEGGYTLQLLTLTLDAFTFPRGGVWFFEQTESSISPTLELPTLTPGWKYEGWAVIDGTPVSTGTFTKATGKDDSNKFSGPSNFVLDSTAFPGENFLEDAPDGLSFPLDLRNQKIVISIEPDADNSPAPFFIKPLEGDVPSDAESALVSNTVYPLETGSVTKITGTVTR